MTPSVSGRGLSIKKNKISNKRNRFGIGIFKGHKSLNMKLVSLPSEGPGGLIWGVVHSEAMSFFARPKYLTKSRAGPWGPPGPLPATGGGESPASNQTLLDGPGLGGTN